MCWDENLAASRAAAAAECEFKSYDHEDKHQQGNIDRADHLPAVEPDFAAPAEGLERAPEAVGEVEPDGCEPNEVELKSLNETKREALGKQEVEAITESSSENEKNSGKKIWWVRDLSVLYDGEKYALKYTGKQGQITKYIYDDVDILNEYQVRFAKKQADGSLRYGVASTCGWKFIMTDCEYIKVNFLDGSSAVLAVDEEDDEYAIDRWGSIFSIEGYREK